VDLSRIGRLPEDSSNCSARIDSGLFKSLVLNESIAARTVGG